MQNYFVTTAVMISLMMVSCSKDNNSASSKDELVSTVSNGTWRITYFFDSDTDETANFSGYDFTFGSSNLLTASNDANNHTGTWSISDSSSGDDSPGDLDFTIGFTSPANFEELTEDWEVLSKTSVKIELRHVSGGDGTTDYLTFEKN